MVRTPSEARPTRRISQGVRTMRVEEGHVVALAPVIVQDGDP